MSVSRSRLLVATEHQEQVTVAQWAQRHERVEPRLCLLYAIPSGGVRFTRTAGRLKGEGGKSGVPDLCLPCPRGQWHGLYLEMKRRRGGQTSDAQDWWITHLRYQGYRVVVARGADEAITAIVEYLGMEGMT